MKKVLLPLFAAAMLTACSNEDMPQTAGQGGEGDNVEIKMSTTALDIDVKKPFDGGINASNTLGALVVVSSTSGAYNGTPYAKGQMIFSDTQTAKTFESAGFSGNRMYPASDSEQLYVRGFYPYSADAWSFDATSATFTVDGKSDIMTTTEMTTSKGQAKEGTYPQLAFTHQLTKLIFKVKAADTQSEQTKVNKMVLSGIQEEKIPTTCKLTFSGNAVAFSGEAETLPVYQDGTDNSFTGLSQELTSTATEVAYVLCPPIANPNTDKDYQLTVTYADNVERTVDIDLKENGNSNSFSQNTAGYAFTVTLEFKATEIKATATVTDWVPGGETTVPID